MNDKTFNQKCNRILKTHDLEKFGKMRFFDFKNTGEDFSAYRQAAEAANKFFTVGSMCFDEPIALADKNHYDHVAKWYNIPAASHPLMSGVLLSDDFRHSHVRLFIFEKSTCPFCGEDIEPAGIRNIYSPFYEQMVFTHRGQQTCAYFNQEQNKN
jgi:hypothetical protein